MKNKEKLRKQGIKKQDRSRVQVSGQSVEYLAVRDKKMSQIKGFT